MFFLDNKHTFFFSTSHLTVYTSNHYILRQKTITLTNSSKTGNTSFTNKHWSDTASAIIKTRKGKQRLA